MTLDPLSRSELLSPTAVLPTTNPVYDRNLKDVRDAGGCTGKVVIIDVPTIYRRINQSVPPEMTWVEFATLWWSIHCAPLIHPRWKVTFILCMDKSTGTTEDDYPRMFLHKNRYKEENPTPTPSAQVLEALNSDLDIDITQGGPCTIWKEDFHIMLGCSYWKNEYFPIKFKKALEYVLEFKLEVRLDYATINSWNERLLPSWPVEIGIIPEDGNADKPLPNVRSEEGASFNELTEFANRAAYYEYRLENSFTPAVREGPSQYRHTYQRSATEKAERAEIACVMAINEPLVTVYFDSWGGGDEVTKLQWHNAVKVAPYDFTNDVVDAKNIPDCAAREADLRCIAWMHFLKPTIPVIAISLDGDVWLACVTYLMQRKTEHLMMVYHKGVTQSRDIIRDLEVFNLALADFFAKQKRTHKHAVLEYYLVLATVDNDYARKPAGFAGKAIKKFIAGDGVSGPLIVGTKESGYMYMPFVSQEVFKQMLLVGDSRSKKLVAERGHQIKWLTGSMDYLLHYFMWAPMPGHHTILMTRIVDDKSVYGFYREKTADGKFAIKQCYE